MAIEAGAAVALVGCERELAHLETFVAATAEGPRLMLEGEPGIGKTALWRVGVSLVENHGVRVLGARPAEAEANLSFSALAGYRLVDPSSP
jgi:MoxR-like ATPase